LFQHDLTHPVGFLLAVADRDFAETGLREAIDRLRQRLQDYPTDPSKDPLISLGEALEWLYALHNHHVSQGTSQLQQATSTDAETERGLVYARGKLVHALLDVAFLVTDPGTLVMRANRSIIRPPTHEFRWASIRARGGDPGEAEYGQHVEGQPLYPPMETAARFITGLP
jgi:hypothetical protein